MTAPGAAPRTLIVGPLGARPWITTEALAAQLRQLGHEVLVNGDGSIVRYPTPLPSNVGRFAVALPRVAFWLGRMMWTWRVDARRALRVAGVTHILVWDPVVCALIRAARPRGTELIWVVPPPEGTRAHQRLLRAVLLLTVDRRVVSETGLMRFRRESEVVARVGGRHIERTGLDGWIVLGAAGASTAAIAALEARRDKQPATAVVFDAREHEQLGPDEAEHMRVASGAERVVWAIDDSWLGSLPSVPREAVDVSATATPDHRHATLVGAGTHIVRLGSSEPGASYKPDGVDDRSWAAAVFASR